MIAAVTGHITIDKLIQIERNNITFDFIPNNKNELSHIAISMRMSKKKLRNFENSMIRESPNAPIIITIGDTSDLDEQLIAELRSLEANLSFLTRFSLHAIELNRVERKFIPETPEEEKLISIGSFVSQIEYDTPPFHLSEKTVSKFFDIIPEIEEITELKALLNSAMIAFHSFRYIDAFRYFYFVVEGLYAGGKYNKEKVLEEFSNSGEFKKITTKALDPQNIGEKDHTDILNLLAKKQLQPTTEGLQSLIYDIRASISHYNSRNKANNPHNHNEFKSIARVMMFIAQYAIRLQEVKVAEKLENKPAS